ncbi:MAG: RtcB family protein, partial [Patescibacteria group bacterium]
MINNFQQIGNCQWQLPRGDNRQAEIDLFLSKELLEQAQQDDSIKQLIDASKLPGVLSPVVGMPDIHEGYGLPIGGVAAFNIGKGVISAGAVGYDINCGVRLIRTNLSAAKIDKPTLRKLMIKIEEKIPTGIGKKGRRGELPFSLEEIVNGGAKKMVAEGFGWQEDLESIEESGQMAGANLAKVSKQAIARGRAQLATLGGGNHFIEIQEIEEIFDIEIANQFGLKKGNISVMVHSGSRGFGHQICSDYLSILMNAAKQENIFIPRRGLAAAPIESVAGKDYFQAMAAAVNFAFANRQLMTHDIREAFEEVFNKNPKNDLEMFLVYDVAHNIAKFEEFKGEKILVHRKGATRAFPAGHPMLNEKYYLTGHPAIVPGSMGTPSYVMVGTDEAEKSWYSINHGSGRLMSRKQAFRQITKEDFEKSMGDILYNARDWRLLADESPLAYKKITEVIDVLVKAGLAKKVAQMKPLAVIKGAGVEG